MQSNHDRLLERLAELERELERLALNAEELMGRVALVASKVTMVKELLKVTS